MTSDYPLIPPLHSPSPYFTTPAPPPLFGSASELFRPEPSKADPEEVRGAAEGFWNLAGRIIGRSGELRDVITGAAVEFTDLVSTDISTGGKYSDGKWREACMALTYAAGVADQWAGDVEKFETHRKALITEFGQALQALKMTEPFKYQQANPDKATITGDFGPYTVDYEAHLGGKVMELLADFSARAAASRAELYSTASTRSTQVKDGPTPGNIKKLVEAGILGWAAYNIQGAAANPPLPVSASEAKKMARDMEAYLKGDKEPDARYFEVVSALTAITNKAKELQAAHDAAPGIADKLRGEDIAFLKTFYQELDGSEFTGPRGVVYLRSILDHTPELDWSTEDKDAFSATVSDGLLILSDERLGGGIQHLPYSVQQFVEGEPGQYDSTDPFGEHSGDDNLDWLNDAREFNRLFQHADPGIQGGTEFSANLTTSMGHHLNGTDGHISWDDELSPLLEVSTRNEDANHAVLSGTYEHPTFKGNANAVKGLFTHDWNDDGAAVGNLTSWIPDAARSDNPVDQQRAREAALGLIEMTTTADMYNDLTDTAFTVKVTGPDGNEHEVTEAAFGLLNPRIAESLGDVTQTYLYDFSLSGDPGSSSFNPELGAMEMGYKTRYRFLEYVMAHDESAAELYASANALEFPNFRAAGEEDANITRIASNQATLRGLLDTGLRFESLDRTGDDEAKQEADQKRRSRIFGDVRTLAYAGTGLVPGGPMGPALAFSVVGLSSSEIDARFIQEDTTIDYQQHNDIDVGDYHPHAPNEFGRTFNQSHLKYKSEIDMLDMLVNDGTIDIEDVRRENPLLVDEKNGSVIDYYAFTGNERSELNVQQSVQNLLSDTPSPNLLPEFENPRSGENTTNAFNLTDKYSELYKEQYNRIIPDIASQLRATGREEASQK